MPAVEDAAFKGRQEADGGVVIEWGTRLADGRIVNYGDHADAEANARWLATKALPENQPAVAVRRTLTPWTEA